MNISRHFTYNSLVNLVKPGTVVILQGACQVGKSVLIKKYLSKTTMRTRVESGTNIQMQELFNSGNSSQITDLADGIDQLIIDDAHLVPALVRGLRILLESYPFLSIILIFSFDIAETELQAFTYSLQVLPVFPVSVGELRNNYSKQKLIDFLDDLVVYGCYPEVIAEHTISKKRQILQHIIGVNLLQDILSQEKVKGVSVLLGLLRMLAFRIGTDISLAQIGKELGIDRKTVSRYIALLEQSFILFTLYGFSGTGKGEIHKMNQYYFYDTGVRNGLVSSFNPLSLRNDTDRLWANFLIAERVKLQNYRAISSKNYFWRNWNQKKIDWIEERDGKLCTYAFNYTKTLVPVPSEFKKAYRSAEFKLIYKDNFLEFTTK